MEEEKNKAIDQRASFEFVRYSNCWEDAEILIKALKAMENGHIMSIASAGDNVLSLLTLNPKLIVAVDLSQSQLACTELKIVAFKTLTHDQVLKFIGVTPCSNRVEIYNQLRKHLSLESKEYWDAHMQAIERGIIHIGKFENYFNLFRSYCLRFIHRKKTVDHLLEEKSLEKRKRFYSEKWNTFGWRIIFKVFFSKRLMGLLGRDPEFFKYVQKDVSSNILQRVKHGVTIVETHNNPYLEYILKGNFNQAHPHYLREENFETIKQNADKITLFKGSIRDALNHYSNIKFDAFNLSDIFEYMNFEEYKIELTHIINSSNKGCKIAFWNMLCPRGSVDDLKNRIEFKEKEGEELLKKDKAFFYQSFKIGVVK